MRTPDPKANTTTEAYLAYKAGYLEESELKPVLYEPYLHFDAWLAYWAGLVGTYPVKNVGKNLFDKNHALIINGYFENEGTIIVAESNRNRIIWLPCKENTTYTVKGQLLQSIAQRVISTTEERPKNGTSVKMYISWVTEDKTFTTPKGASFIVIRFQSASGTDIETLMQDIVDTLQIEEGSTASAYEPYTGEPEMLTDEEALVAYLAGVTDTYPEDIKDPYDVRIVGYLKYLVSARWGRPEYPVNNEEFYLSTMKPPVVPSGDTPSSDIEMDDTAEAPFIDLKMYGDTSQQAYSGFQLLQKQGLATPTTDTNFWTAISYQTITALEDGWARFTSSSSSATKNFFIGRSGGFDWQTDTLYTVICEIRNAPSAGRLTLAQPQNTTDPFDNVSVGVQADYTFDGSDYIFVFSGTTKSSVGSVGLRPFFNSNFASESSVDLRLTIVAGDHTSDYQNYIGDNWEPYTGVIPAPNPDYPQPVNVVTGRQVVAVTGEGGESADYEINLGKNLFDKSNPNVIVGTVEAGGYNASGSNKSFYLECESNTTYTVQKRNDGDTNRFVVATANTIPVQGTAMSGLTQKNNDSSITITTGNDAKYIVCTFYRTTEATLTEQELIDSIQVEVGSTATSYAPYFEPIELCKIGDYQDYIYRDEDGDWYIHRNVQHLSLSVSSMDSDSENYPGWTSPSITDILTNTLPDGNYPLVENTSLLCSCLGSGGDMINKVRWNNNISTPKLYLSKTSSEYYQLSYSEWIEQYPNLVFELYYGIVKNAPRTIITNPELISQLNALMEGGSYEGKTYIKVTATKPNLPGLLYVEAGKYD